MSDRLISTIIIILPNPQHITDFNQNTVVLGRCVACVTKKKKKNEENRIRKEEKLSKPTHLVLTELLVYLSIHSADNKS